MSRFVLGKKKTIFEDVKQCFEIFQTNGVPNVVVHENQAFLINNAFAIHVEDLLHKICQTSYPIFFEAVEEYKKFIKLIGTEFADNMLSLTTFEISNLLIQSEKFKPFLIDKNLQETYLQLSVTINDMLQETTQDLKSYDWLKLVPRDMLMNNESATKLLELLRYVKGKYDIYSNNGGLINIGCTQLHISKWLQVRRNDENLDQLLDALQSFNFDNSKSINWRLQINGSLSYEPIEEKYLPYSLQNFLLNKDVKDVVESFLLLCKEKEKNLYITLGSDKFLMLGNFIWGDVKEIKIMKEKFVDMVCLFEKVMEQDYKNSMSSIYGLTKKSKFDKEKAIKMARTINMNLEELSDDIICNKYFKIIPTDLWGKCDERSETYDEIINVFEMLQNNQIFWLIKLNGTVELDGCIIVTISHLLSFYSRVLNYANPAESLNHLIREIKKYTELSLICKEAVEYYKNFNFFKTEISSYKDVTDTFINLKKEGMFKNLRMEPNGTLCVNEHIWIKADDKYIDEIAKLSEIINEVFQNEKYNKFQFGHPGTSILTSMFNTSNYQLYQYCYNMCMLIEEAYPKINVAYISDSDMFRFNDLFSIHPRSFFHLQSMDAVISVIEKYADFKKRNLDFLKGPVVSDEEKTFCKELWKIKKNERIEFDVMRETFLQQMGKIIWNNKTDLKEIGNIGNILDEKKPYHGIEQIKIQDMSVFKEGNANGFLTISNEGTVKIEFHEKYIHDALKFAAVVEKYDTCCNLSDFLSLVEIVKAYEKFVKCREELKLNDLPSHVQNKSRYDQIKWWLTKVNEIQKNSPRKYKFLNSLKGLHHWFKHHHSFKDLKEYYDKMIEFFDRADYVLELDTQKGEFVSRYYEDPLYEGYIVYDAENRDNKKQVVTTFWYSPRKLRKTKKNENQLGYDSSCLLSKYLVIADTNFNNYQSIPKVWLDNDIVVRTLSLSGLFTFVTLRQYIENTQFENIRNVEKLILFLAKTVKNDNKTINKSENQNQAGTSKTVSKTKTVLDYSECFQQLKDVIEKKYDKEKVDFILCYSSDINPEKLQIIKNKWPYQLIKIKDDVIQNKDSVQLKEYIENIFGII